MCRNQEEVSGAGGVCKMNGKYKLRVIILVILFLLAGWSVLVFYNYKKAHTVPEHIYVEDYPEIYAEELQIIFADANRRECQN